MKRFNMQDAYLLERKVLPAVIAMETNGVRMCETVGPEYLKWRKKFERGERYLHKIVGEVKLGGKLMFNVLREKGFINESRIVLTAKGNPRYGKDFLPDLIDDKKLKDVLINRSRMQKVIGTYLKPWSESWSKYGRFYPYYNQVRNEEDYGTMTGRFSSNFQQVPKNGEKALVNLRRFILPEKGCVIIQRDYSGQEMRIAAHYAEGNILKCFQDDPDFDIHNMVQAEILELVKRLIERPTIKIIGFLKLYGGGPNALSQQTGISYTEAQEFFRFFDQAIPEFKELAKTLEAQVKSGTLLRTWGGRLYDVEAPKFVDGKMRSFYYKLINILIQGSAADMMKYAIAQYYHHPDRRGTLMLTVHDELAVSIQERFSKREMKLLKECMENSPHWDLDMLSDGKIGPNSVSVHL